jgi:hypothetical protein
MLSASTALAYDLSFLLRPAAGRVRGMRRQRYPRRPPRPPPTNHGQQHLHAKTVPAIWLEDFQAGVIVELLSGECVRDVLADVIVPDAPGVGIAVRTLAYLR